MSEQDDFVTALLDPEAPLPRDLATWNGSNPAARFAIYRNNVTVSLIDALADTYPVAQALVGERFFRAMARLFVQKTLPQSPVMSRYGAAFPAFIADFEPADSVPYLADMARLELLRTQACHCADAAPLSTARLAQLLSDTQTLPQQRVALHPSAQLIRSDYAVVSLWAAHQDLAERHRVNPCTPEQALIVRPGLDVEVIPIDPGMCRFLEQLLGAAPLGRALEDTCLSHPDFDLVAALGLLIQRGLIVDLPLETTT